jgi:hypothetical protein
MFYLNKITSDILFYESSDIQEADEIIKNTDFDSVEILRESIRFNEKRFFMVFRKRQ